MESLPARKTMHRHTTTQQKVRFCAAPRFSSVCHNNSYRLTVPKLTVSSRCVSVVIRLCFVPPSFCWTMWFRRWIWILAVSSKQFREKSVVCACFSGLVSVSSIGLRFELALFETRLSSITEKMKIWRHSPLSNLLIHWSFVFADVTQPIFRKCNSCSRISAIRIKWMLSISHIFIPRIRFQLISLSNTFCVTIYSNARRWNTRQNKTQIESKKKKKILEKKSWLTSKSPGQLHQPMRQKKPQPSTMIYRHRSALKAIAFESTMSIT